MQFDIPDTLKEHYLFDAELLDVVHCFFIVFKREERELLRRFIHRLEPLYGEPAFSPTVNSIADIIVYKYFNNKLSFMEKCFLRSSKFKGSLFQNKIIELEKK